MKKNIKRNNFLQLGYKITLNIISMYFNVLSCALRNFRRILIVFLCTSIVIPCISLPSQSDSLLQYMEIAARNNPTVLQRFSEYKAALQKVPQVGALSDPEFNLGVFIQPMELVEGKQLADFQLMQMFPWFGTLKAAKDEMSLMAKAKFELFRDAKLQVFYDVQRTWFELYKIEQEKRVSEKNRQLLTTIERLAIVKFKSGPTGTNVSSGQPMGPGSSGTSQNPQAGSAGMQTMPGGQQSGNSSSGSTISGNSMGGAPSGGSGLVDLYRIQMEAGELDNNIAQLLTLQNTIVARFNSYLNRPLQSPVAIPDTLVADSLEIPLTSVTDSLLRNNPMLGMLQYEQQSFEARKKMVTRMGYPMMGLGVTYNLIGKNEMSTSSMNGKDMIMPMLKLTLPIYRNKYNALRTEAALLKTATGENYTATSNALQSEYYEAVQLYQDAQRRNKLYTNQYLLASKTLDLMLKSFSTSGSTLTDVLRIRQQALDYQLKQIEAIADFNTGIAWLKRLMAFYQTK